MHEPESDMATPVTTVVVRRPPAWRTRRRIHGRGTNARPPWRRHAAAWCALIAFMSSACAGGDDASDEPVRTDSTGVALVLNSGADRMLAWTFERVVDLGGADDGPTAFFRVFPTSVGVDSLGNLYVLDAGNYRVSVFDREGGYLRAFGRQGEGPGELGFPSDMAVTPAGEVAVYDFARRALVRFDAEGTFTGTFSLPGPLQRQMALVADGRIAAAVAQPTAAADSTDYRLVTFGRDTVEIARVRQLSRPRSQPLSCPVPAQPSYFRPRVVWAAAGDWIAVSDDASYSVRIVDRTRVAAIWRRDLPVIESTLDLAAWEVAGGDSLRFRGCAVPAEEAARTFGYAQVAPIVRRLAVARDGAVWARRISPT